MLKLTFTRVSETKNTVRFIELLDDDRQRGVIGTLYLLKSQDREFGQPQTLDVTVNAKSSKVK